MDIVRRKLTLDNKKLHNYDLLSVLMVPVTVEKQRNGPVSHPRREGMVILHSQKLG